METPRLLDALERMGFDEAAFQQLHPFGPNVTIETHRSDCAKTADSRKDVNDELLERRLLYVLHRARTERAANRAPDFQGLARMANEVVLPAL